MESNIVRRVVIEEASDSLDIVLLDMEGNPTARFHSPEEEPKIGLVKLFETLGINASYEEIY